MQGSGPPGAGLKPFGLVLNTHLSLVHSLSRRPSGHFGQVREVRERATGAQWAGKFLKLKRGVGSRLGLERKNVEKEVEILQSLQHQNIMALKDVFESRAEVVLIVEL